MEIRREFCTASRAKAWKTHARFSTGILISFAGNITFKNAENLREVVPFIPLDRMLTETDSPYLAPIPHRGKRNEPAFVRGVVQELAAINIPEDLARQVP